MATLSYDPADRVLELTFPYNPELVAIAKTIYGYRWKKSKKAWEYPPTLETARALVEKFDPDAGLGFAAWHTRAVTDRKAADRANALLDGTAEAVGDFGFTFHSTPYAHQREYCEWAAARSLAGLTYRAQFSEQGTGKTKSEIDMTIWEIDRGICTGAPVIFCPNSVKRTWASEIHMHAPGGLFEPVILNGSAEEKLRVLDSLHRFADAGIMPFLIINYEVLSQPSQKEVYAKLIELRDRGIFGKVVFDEATALKNVKSNRGANAYLFARDMPVRVVMTGTPYPKVLTDIFNLMRVLDVGILGASWPAFRKHHEIRGGWQGKEVIGFANEDELREKVNRHAVRVLLEDCIDMPEEVNVERRCDLSKDQVRATDDLRKRMLAELIDEDGTAYVISADQAMTQLLRFNQISSGFLEQGTSTVRFKPNPKLDLLVDIIRDEIPEDEKIVVWCCYRADVRAIAEVLARAKIGCATFYGGVKQEDRGAEEDRFKTDPTCRVMIATPDAGGYGLNWQAACNCIFYSYGFKWEALEQAKARIRRLTQRKRMQYIWLVAENPNTRAATHGAATGINQYILENLSQTSRLASFMTGDSKDPATFVRQALEVM